MKVLGILGSPRVNGITAKLLNDVLGRFKNKKDWSIYNKVKCEKVILNALKISPCRECIGCKTTGECILEDEMREIYKKINKASVIVLASPIFFMSLPAHVKAMIDRCQSIWVKKYILKNRKTKKKKGIFIAVSGSKRKDVFKGAISIIKAFFATINASYSEEILLPGTDDEIVKK